MGILTAPSPKRLQLYHHDNGDLEFIHRHIIGSSATELDNNKMPLRSWWDPYATLYPFDGYMKIPADAIQLAFGRHYHLEIHDILPDDIRPPADNSMDTPFISSISESRAMEITRTAKPKSIYEHITLILGAGFIIQLLIWGLSTVVQ